MRRWRVLGTLPFLLAGCATTPRTSELPRPIPPAASSAPEKLPPVQAAVPPNTPRKSGGYYLDDGPLDTVPTDLLSIPDPIPRREPYHSGSNRPYEVLGEVYFPDISELPFSERGVATWYGRKFHGKPTSSGEPYDMFAMTAAHKTLPIPSYARVTNIQNGQSVIVRINDRGPFFPGRVIDLSYTAASKLGFAGKGSGEVLVERVFPGEGPRIANQEVRPAPPATQATEPVARYFLQLGAFSEQSNAERLMASAKTSLSEWAAKITLDSDGRIHRIKVGPIPSDRIGALSDLIEKSLNIKPRVIAP